jgi:hypothetical protein
MSKRIITHHNLLSISLLTLLITSLSIMVQPAFCQSYDPTQSFQAANNSVNLAFDTVLKAEKAGANVKALLTQLNAAASLIAQAENSYRSGDTSSIESNTDQAVAIARQVTAQATTLKQEAATSNQNALIISIVIAFLGSTILVLALYLVWGIFKSHYFKRVLESKPEVVDN